MKKLIFKTLTLAMAIAFSSCSLEDEQPLEVVSTAPLYEKVIVQRDASGAYSVDYKFKEGTGYDVAFDDETNMSDVYLYPNTSETEKQLFQDLSLNGKDQLSLGLNNTITNSKSIITVFDEDIKFSRSSEKDHLAEYKMTDNADGTYTLDFVTDPSIFVEFVEKNDKRYEIHLTPSNEKSSEQKFSRTFEKSSDEKMKVTFVNYFYKENGRSSESFFEKRKPVVSWE